MSKTSHIWICYQTKHTCTGGLRSNYIFCIPVLRKCIPSTILHNALLCTLFRSSNDMNHKDIALTVTSRATFHIKLPLHQTNYITYSMSHKYTMYRHGQCPKKQSFVIVTSSLITTKKVHVICSVSKTELRPWPNNLRIHICCKCNVCDVQFRKQFAEKFLERFMLQS